MNNNDRLAMLKVLHAITMAASGSKIVRTPRSGLARPLSVVIIVALDQEEGRVTALTDLQAQLNIAQASASRCISAFVKKRTLQLVPVPDGRRTCVCLGSKGREYIEHILDAMYQACLREGLRLLPKA